MEEPKPMNPETILKLVALGSFAFAFISTLHVLYSSSK